MKIIDQICKLWATKALPILVSLSPKQRFLAAFCSLVFLLWIVKICFNVEDARYEPDLVVSEDVAELDSAEVELSAPVAAEEPVTEKHAWPYYYTGIISWNDKEFDDVQDVQIASAIKNGIKHTISNRDMAEEEVAKGNLVFVGANPMFYMDDLQHSIPYLVPKAYRLLNRIGVNFVDSLISKNLPVHALVVTSVLRTESDVNRLQRSNKNATTNSCHLYATTFDISWRSYKEIGVDPQNSAHTQEQEIALKRALGEVLRDLRYEGRCYVKHERKESCFHITVR